MDKLTVIIPVHEFNESVGSYLKSALITVEQQNKIDKVPPVLIVYAHTIHDELKNFIDKLETELNISLLKNENNTDFQSQINFAVKNIESEYFSILEFDDEFNTTYFYNAFRYIEKLPEVDLFIPVLVEVNDEQNAIKLTNQTVWSKQFVGENGVVGFLNANALNQYTDFKISGGIFKKSEFEAVGGLKSNIKLTFTYEFLLRLLNNASKIYNIPKILIKHLTTREGSLFDEYSKNMSFEERKFWFDTAKKESNFLNDRVIDLSSLKQ